MNASQVDSAIARASRLMNDDYMSYLDKRAKQQRNGSTASGKVNDLSMLEEQAFGYSQPQQVPVQPQTQPQTAQFKSSALRESFSKMPPISDNTFPSDANYQPGISLLREQVAPQQQYVQQPQYVQPIQQAPQVQQIPVGGIDYNMIKYIVNEAVKENIEAMKKSLLNENALRGISMPGGGKIQFLDTKGNLYEGQLSLKKKKQQ